ncbi:MAG: Dihydrolipoyllysine-residue succinyltransferase component of 2-oxoglutarate dehydrogenase complex [Chlamydiae bacterium]|nr:Dihydrolipoyllysine-residue succinyltransferase component of 2-oxoglutarate dehydrogenase complex [Chlamydiota bacterium]
MSIEIKVPSLGESISEATISEVIVQSGSQVTQDQEILEIETEKVNQVLFAPEAGVLNLTVKVGDTVAIGQVIGSVDPAGSAKPAEDSQKETPQTENKEEKTQTPPENKEEKTQTPPEDKAEEPKAEKSSKEVEKNENEPAVFDEIRKSPEAFVEQLRAPSSQPKSSHPIENPLDQKPKQAGAREERKKMPKIRQTIARRLVEAKQTMALLTTFNEVDMSTVMELRKKHKDAFEKQHGVRLGFMSFFVKAAANALKKYPQVNAYIDGEDFVFRKYYDINVAISSDRGLVVPVIEDCDGLSFAQVEQKIMDLATRAKTSQITMDEMRSGGFTISNGGVFGSTFSTPIVNPPQSAILGMHRIAERPYVVDGKIVIRPIMILALSYDHRIIDGQEAVSFLAHIVKSIEDPATLLIDL